MREIFKDRCLTSFPPHNIDNNVIVLPPFKYILWKAFKLCDELILNFDICSYFRYFEYNPILKDELLWYKLFIINYRVLHYTSNFHNWNEISKNGRDIKRWSILKHVKLHFRSIMVKWHIFLNDLVNASTICLKICQMFHI